MSYPGDPEYQEYMQYLQDHDINDPASPRLTIEQWREMKKQEEAQPMQGPSLRMMR